MSVEEQGPFLVKEELIAEIQRRVAYLLSTDDYTVDEKEVIARRFFQALEGEEE